MMNNYTISSDRAIKLLKNCLDWFEDDCCEYAETLKIFELLGLSDADIEALGYGYLLDIKEDS